MKEAKVDFEEGIVDLFIDGKLVKSVSAWTFDAKKAYKDGWELEYNYKRGNNL